MQTQLKVHPLAPYLRVIKALALAFVLAVLTVCLMFIPFTKKETGSEISPLLALAVYIIINVIVLWFVKRRLSPDKKMPSIDRFDAKMFVQLLFIFIPVTILSVALSLVVDIPSTSSDSLVAFFEANQIIFFFLIVVAAPILEELIFRGVILRYLLENLKPAPAILFSSLLFGLIHFSPDQIVHAFLGGIFLGYAYFKSNNLLMSIIFHALNNAIAFIAFMAFQI